MTMPPAPPSPYLEHAPAPMATVEGAAHLVRYINPAFCRLIDKAEADVVGKSFRELVPDTVACLALLERVYRTRQSASHIAREDADPHPVFLSYVMWPVIADDRTVCVIIQVTEAGSLQQKTMAMNEALLLGSLRQSELVEAADASNIQLQTEVDDRKQRESDALMLNHEIAHRIKNNLNIVSALVDSEIRRTPDQYVQGYEAMQTRIQAISKLYDLISQSHQTGTVRLDTYLQEIADTMSRSLLDRTSGIKIIVKAEALELDHERAVHFGLVANELVTNAVKHAFPDGVGRVTLGVARAGDQIQFTVADNGVGMATSGHAAPTGTHGRDYAAMFVRQLAGTMSVSEAETTGTTVTIRFPLLAAS